MKPAPVVSSLNVHFALYHRHNAKSVKTIGLAANSRQAAIRRACVISVGHSLGKGFARRMNVFGTEGKSVRSILATNGVSMLRQTSYSTSAFARLFVCPIAFSGIRAFLTRDANSHTLNRHYPKTGHNILSLVHILETCFLQHGKAGFHHCLTYYQYSLSRTA